MRIKNVLLLAQLSLIPALVMAKGNGRSAGQTMLDPLSARPAALGESMTAGSNDISILQYNPASLSTLKSKQASLLYQKGLVEDSYGHISYGSPSEKGGYGVTLGYYNGGDIGVFDGVSERTVKAKQDMMLTLGYSKILGSLHSGVAIKGISSEIAETQKSNAYAVDLGVLREMGERFTLGASLQNFGTKLSGSNLSRIARVGGAVRMVQRKVPTQLFIDLPYYRNESELRPGIGLESMVGPLALRVGYKSKIDQQSVTFGAGFMIGMMSLDYSYGLVEDLDATHKASMTFKFGGEQGNLISENKNTPRSDLLSYKERMHKNRVYVVQSGDSLKSIARTMYGDVSAWRRIQSANSDVLQNTETLEMGQRIVLP